MNGHLSRTDTLPAHRRYYCIFFVFSDEKMTTISLLPRRRPPGTKYGKWTEEDMNNAIADVNDGIGINRSSRDNRVPKATLLRHLYNKNVHANASKKHFGRCTDLPEAVEMELAKHVIKPGEQNCGMTTKSLRHLAYEIAPRHTILNTDLIKIRKWPEKHGSDASDEVTRNFPCAPLNRLQSPDLLHSLLMP